MIRREWLLGVGLLSGSVGTGFSSMPALAQGDAAAGGSPIGTVAAVKPDAFGAPPSAAEQNLVIGAGVVQDERIRTTAQGTANVIFADRTTLTVGKDSEVTLDKFVYDPASGGGMALSLTKGALRFIGGQLSKGAEGVQVKTPTATMTVRGGIALFFTAPDGSTVAVLLYGVALTDLGSGQQINRPGFMFTFPADGGPPVISKVSDTALNQLLNQFSAQSGVGAELPDEELAQLDQQLQDGRVAGLISTLRDQVNQLSQTNNPVLDAVRQSLSQTPTMVPETQPQNNTGGGGTGSGGGSGGGSI